LEFVGGGSTFIVNITNHGLITGDDVILAGVAGPLGATPAAQINATHTITRIDANSFSITVTTPHAQASGNVAAQAALTANTRQFSGNILNATSAGSTFLGGSTPSSSFTTAALTFTIATPSTGTVSFSYTNTAPNIFDGQFNNLNTLAQAINDTNGLTARVVNGRLVVSAEDASETVTFGNGDAVGTGTQRGIDWVRELGVADVGSSPVTGTDTRRFNSLQSLADLINADAEITAVVSDPLSAASLEIRIDDPLGTIQLRDIQTSVIFEANDANAIQVPAGVYNSTTPIPITIADTGFPANIGVGDYVDISGMVVPGLPVGYPNGTFLQVTAVNPGVSFTVAATLPAGSTFTLGAPIATNATAGNRISLIGESNSGSVIAALGIPGSIPLPPTGSFLTLPTGTYTTPLDTAQLGPRYNPLRDPNDANAVGNNMASGDITAQFSRNIRIYDSLGSGHDVRFSFIKTAQNTWAVEIHAIPETDVSSTFPNGIVAYGNIFFNGDGSLRSVDTSLTGAININWTNGAVSSDITLDLGTAGQPFGTVGATSIGLTDGLSQFDSSYNVAFANQNGAPVGQLVSVSINEEGQIIASYSNGETQALFQLPIADFANPDGLRSISGNVYAQTRESGEVNLREAGSNGTGSVVSSALEQSNVDLAEQLTDMIVAQRAYQANTRVISTTDELLEQLNQL
jgi:flagellar hook-basal body protein